SEKEGLESSVFQLQAQLAQLQARNQQLESEGRTLLQAKEALEAELGVSRQERAQELRCRRRAVAAAEAAAVTVTLRSARDAHRDQLEQLQRHKEELEAERGRLMQEQDELVAELAALRQQHQSEKQQALALQEEERAALAETLAGLQRSLDEATAELEQQRREVTTHQEKEQ
ncbi:rootletin-like, partial [Neopelma chrysocephalum]